MNADDLICLYLKNRGELAAAYAVPHWKSSRLGHIDRVSRELAVIEHALEDAGIDEAVFTDLLAGRLG